MPSTKSIPQIGHCIACVAPWPYQPLSTILLNQKTNQICKLIQLLGLGDRKLGLSYRYFKEISFLTYVLILFYIQQYAKLFNFENSALKSKKKAFNSICIHNRLPLPKTPNDRQKQKSFTQSSLILVASRE